MRLSLYAPVFVRPSETFIYDLTTELTAAGVETDVITARRELADERPFEQIRIVPKPGRWSPDRLSRRILGRLEGRDATTEAYRARLRKALSAAEPDVMLAEYGDSGVILEPLARQMGIPLVVCFHGADATRAARSPYWRSRYAKMFKHVSAATGPSQYIRDKLIELGCPSERAHVMHNGVRLDHIPFTAPADRFNGQEIRFLFVGRLTEKKAPLTLLRSFAGTKGAIADKQVSLTIAGDGPMRQQVETEIRALQIEDSVELLGRQPHSRIIELFGDAHIYVQHSITAADGDQEGLPVSITEALASGLPVVSTRHSGIPEIIRHGETGLLVDERDETGMAHAMTELANDPDRWRLYGMAGRSLLEQEFAMPVIRQKMQRFLQSVRDQHQSDSACT